MQEFYRRIGGERTLTPEERNIYARVRRRIANREYAKRSRDERRKQMQLTQERLCYLEAVNECLVHEIALLREANRARNCCKNAYLETTEFPLLLN